MAEDFTPSRTTRVERAFAFTDLEGDDRAVAVLSLFRDIVRSIASERGVVEIEHELSTLVPLPLRAGVTVGPVILIDGDDCIGHADNMASRLCALLVNTHAEPMGCREIFGVGEPIEVVRLTAHD